VAKISGRGVLEMQKKQRGKEEGKETETRKIKGFKAKKNGQYFQGENSNDKRGGDALKNTNGGRVCGYMRKKQPKERFKEKKVSKKKKIKRNAHLNIIPGELEKGEKGKGPCGYLFHCSGGKDPKGGENPRLGLRSKGNVITMKKKNIPVTGNRGWGGL